MDSNDRWQEYLKKPSVFAEIETARKKIDAVKKEQRAKRRNNQIAFAIITAICALMLYGLLK